MEYARTPAGQIQVDFARRAGQLLLQYEQLSIGLPAEERFEATLAVALLQSMLTICQEMLRRSPKRSVRGAAGAGLSAMASRSVLDEPALLGLEADCIVETWPSTRGLTYREVFECLRNALSHPCPQGGTKYPVTGYTTVASKAGCIAVFEFVQSSWVNRNGNDLLPRFAPDKTDEEAGRKLQVEVKGWADNAAVVGLVARRNADGQWRVYRGGEQFVPVLRIRLTVQQLRTLTLTLSDLLSSSLESASAIPA